MTVVKVLLQGYARRQEGGWKANSSVVLIRADGKTIIADPGAEREKLLAALKKEGLKTTDINFVFLSHGHIDHALLAGIFENAVVIDELYSYRKDSIANHKGFVTEHVKVLRTPGHLEDHCSLLVETEQGTYAIAGDAFWWLDGEMQIADVGKPDNDPEHMDLRRLIASRKKLLELADYIIPGHGTMFKVEK